MGAENFVTMSNFINGEWKEASTNQFSSIISPVNGLVVGQVNKSSKEDVDYALSCARATFEQGIWSDLPLEERIQIMTKFNRLIGENKQELINLDGITTGHPIRMLEADLFLIQTMISTTIELARHYPISKELPIIPAAGASKNTVYREPIGVVGAISAWNFPMQLALWKIVPALLMGNSIVIKPASNTPFATLRLAELAFKAGVPAGVFNVIVGPGNEVGEYLVSHPEVDKVSFTGSTEVGKRISELASHSIKRVTLELGGKSAAIVLPDADLDLVIPGTLFGFLFNAGQACESCTRLLVHEDIYEEVIDRLCSEVKNLKIGDPTLSETVIGPVISKSQLETISSYINSAIEEGATLAYGGAKISEHPFDNGNFIQPTILRDVSNDMKAAREEIFGPVLTVIKFKTEEEAITLANESIYGLAGGVWSRDVLKAQKIAKKIRAGVVWINDWHAFRYDGPFGGYKQSGNGREHGMEVFNEYTEAKHIAMTLVNQREYRQNIKLLFS